MKRWLTCVLRSINVFGSEFKCPNFGRQGVGSVILPSLIAQFALQSNHSDSYGAETTILHIGRRSITEIRYPRVVVTSFWSAPIPVLFRKDLAVGKYSP